MKIPARIVAIFWSVVALFFVAENLSSRLVAGRPVDWEWDFYNELLYWAMWAVLTPLIVYCFNRWPLRRAARTLAAHSLGAAAVSVLQVGGMFLLHIVALILLGRLALTGLDGWMTRAHVRSAFVVFLLFTAFWKYWVVLALLAAWRYARLYVDAQSRVEHLQLERLKAQIQPHFLFNTLNSISVLARDEPAAAQQMIVQLSELLRLATETRDTQLVTLREELEFTQRYLEIQRLRFGDRLRVQVVVKQEALDVEVPHLLLQPLVENSIQHGLNGASGGSVNITAFLDGPDLMITISDEAAPEAAAADATRGSGLGLSNARSRLEWIYGGRAQLSLERANGGSLVTIRLPAR